MDGIGRKRMMGRWREGRRRVEVAHFVCGKSAPIRIQCNFYLILFSTCIFCAKTFFLIRIQIQMEITQLTYPIPLVELQDNASPSLQSSSPLQTLIGIDKLIQGLLQKNLPPFIIHDHHQIRRETQEPDSENSNIKDKILNYCRKDKSLAELSRKFINKFQGSGNYLIALDQVTSQLKVERRRIYDIVNIMESLGVVSKEKKNLYRWNGLIEAIETIGIYSQGGLPRKIEKNKKEKSLQSLACQFLKLLITQDRILTLDEAADLITKGNSDKQSRKTKIRRLYDIVNVFKCIELVQKVSNCGQKSGFKWKGCHDLLKFISSKNSQNFMINTSSDEEIEPKSNKSNSFQKRNITLIGQEICQQNRAQEASETKLKLEFNVEAANQERNCGFSYFENIMKGINAQQLKSTEDIHRRFTQLVWPKSSFDQ